jgi:hypothetical protein
MMSKLPVIANVAPLPSDTTGSDVLGNAYGPESDRNRTGGAHRAV